MVFFANGIAIGSWAASIPFIKSRLGLTPFQLSAGLFGFSVGAILAMKIAPEVAKKLGAARALKYLMLLFASALLCVFYIQNLGQLVIFLAILGMANGAADVFQSLYGSYVERDALRPMMSSFHGAWSVGCALGSIMFGFAIHHHVPFKMILLLPATMILLVYITVMYLGLNKKGRVDDKHGFKLKDISPEVWFLGGLAGLAMFIEGTVTDWSAIYLLNYLHVTTQFSSVGFTWFMLAMAVTRLVGDQLVGILGEIRLIKISGYLTLTGMALVLSQLDTLVCIIGFVLVGVGIANVIPLAFRAAARNIKCSSINISAAATFGYSMYLMGPPFVGYVAEKTGLDHAFYLMVIAGVGMLVIGPSSIRNTMKYKVDHVQVVK